MIKHVFNKLIQCFTVYAENDTTRDVGHATLFVYSQNQAKNAHAEENF